MDSMEYDETLDMLDDLTEEELNELNDSFDPENNLLPIHERINYDCRKEPSRFFNKNQLSEHLKAKLNFGDARPVTHPKSMAEKIKEAESKLYSDYVPFVKVQKDFSNHTLEVPKLKAIPKPRTPSPLPDLTDEEIKVIENATEDELVEVAAQLKMNDLVTAAQIESISRGDKPLGTGILRPTLIRTQYPQKSISIDEDDDEEDYIDVDGMVKALRSKGEDISIIVCNNQPYMDPEVLEEIAAHLQANKNIRHLSLANCNFTDSVVESFAEALQSNTKLETLNLESNFITPIGIKKLLDAIQDSKTLREIRLENQYSKIGPKCEAEMAAAIEKNFAMLSFGYSFETRGPRDAMNRYILRNNDILRAARRNGETCYNLAEQKKIVAKFKPPWILRRPKRRGPETFEGRKIVMRGDSKKKKKKGPAMMNEMLAKAAQVSKRYEEKERSGELHSEFKRIEDKSKLKVEKGQQEGDGTTSRRGGRRSRQAEEDDEQDGAENGEVEKKRRGRGAPSNDAESMGAMTRRRRRRGDDDDDEDDGEGGGDSKKVDENEDAADGKQKREKMDAETRRRAMRGGKVIEDEKTPLGAAARRRRGQVDDDEEGIDFSQFEQKPEEESEQGAADKSSNDDAGTQKRVPSGKKLTGQEVASLDNASIRGRRRNRAADDEGEDLDAMLSGVGGGDEGGKRGSKQANQGEAPDEDSTLRRRRRGSDDEGESLDDMLNSVPKVSDAEEGNTKENDAVIVGKNGARIPSGKAIGAQQVERMETSSLRGRRRRKVPDEDEGESLDDLLKTVDSKPVERESGEDAGNAKVDENEAGSRRESVTKLPSGRQIRQQAVEQLTAASFKGRRKHRAYEDEEEDIDSLLSSVKAAESDDALDQDEEMYDRGGEKEGERRRVGNAGIAEREKESFGTARRRRREGGIEEEVGAKDVDEYIDEGSESDADEAKKDKTTRNDEDKKTKGGRVPKGAAITTQETVSLDNASMRGRRRHVIRDEEEDLDSVLAGVASSDERKSDDMEENRNSEKETKPQGKEKRLPRGERIAEQNLQSLGALSFKDRRRRRIEDEEEEGIDSILSQAPSTEGQNELDQNNNKKNEESSKARIPSGKAITKSESTPLESLSFAERRRRRKQDDDEDTEPSKEETIANGYVEDIAGDRARRRRRPKDDEEDDEDLEKKREMRRKQREVSSTSQEKVLNGETAVEKPAPLEEKKPEPKVETPVIQAAEKPAIDFSRPMTLRERRRLKEQGLL